jgi:hypothetical protein
LGTNWCYRCGKWDISCEAVTRKIGTVLVYLDGNNGRVQEKCDHLNCLGHVGFVCFFFFGIQGWVILCMLSQQLNFVRNMCMTWSFELERVILAKDFMNA